MWIYKENTLEESNIPEKSIGFVYKISHIPSGKFYYGRKLLTKAATKTIKGKTKKIRKKSDWEDYWSSSPALIDFITEQGKDNFKREILLFVVSKSCLIYAEEYILFVSGSLFDEKCMNGNIRSRIQRTWFNKTPNLHKELKLITPQLFH